MIFCLCSVFFKLFATFGCPHPCLFSFLNKWGFLVSDVYLRLGEVRLRIYLPLRVSKGVNKGVRIVHHRG